MEQVELVVLGLARRGDRAEQPPDLVPQQQRRVVERDVGEHARRLPVVRQRARAVQRGGGRRARLRQQVRLAVVGEHERIREVMGRRERDADVAQAALVVELADVDVPVAVSPRDLLEEQPRAVAGAQRERIGPVAPARRPQLPAPREAQRRRAVLARADHQRPLLVPEREVDAVGDQPHQDAAGDREQRRDAGAAGRDPRHLRLVLPGDDVHAVAQVAQAAGGEVPAAQQRRATHPLQRDEVGAHGRAGEHRAVGLAHERDLAGQAALADVAQVGHVVAPLAPDAVAVGPHPVPRAAEERVALASERDRDVERLGGSARGAALAAIDDRHAREQVGRVDAIERVRIDREDAAVGRAVQAQQYAREAAIGRALGGRQHHQCELDAVDGEQLEQHVTLPAPDPPPLERDADPDEALPTHDPHCPASAMSGVRSRPVLSGCCARSAPPRAAPARACRSRGSRPSSGRAAAGRGAGPASATPTTRPG